MPKSAEETAQSVAYGRNEISYWDYLDEVEFASQVRTHLDRGRALRAVAA